MKKQTKILIIIGILLLIYPVLNYFGAFSFLNQPLNKIVAGEPDKTCNQDTDCRVTWPICGSCECDVVNQEWRKYCPFRPLYYTLCLCPIIENNLTIKCIENQCTAK